MTSNESGPTLGRIGIELLEQGLRGAEVGIKLKHPHRVVAGIVDLSGGTKCMRQIHSDTAATWCPAEGVLPEFDRPGQVSGASLEHSKVRLHVNQRTIDSKSFAVRFE